MNTFNNKLIESFKMKNLLLLSLILVGFASCSKDDATLEIMRPKTLIIETTDNKAVYKNTAFFYYSGNHIDSISFTGGKTIMKYESNTITLNIIDNGDKSPGYRSVYEYNTLGKISKHTNYYNANSNSTIPSYTIQEVYQYEYNTDGTLKISKYSGGNSTVNHYNIITFDIKGNMVQDIEYDLINGDYKMMHKLDYTYDNNCHYLKNVPIVPLSFDQYNTFVNNVTSEMSEYFTYNSSTGLTSNGKTETKYTLEYNSSGFPTSITSPNEVIRIIY